MREIMLPDLELSAEDNMAARIVMRSVDSKHLILNVEQVAEFNHLAEAYRDKINPIPNPSEADKAGTMLKSPFRTKY